MFCYMQVLINRNTIANVTCQAGMKLTYLPYRHILLTEKNLTRLKSDVEFIRHSVRVEMYEEFSFLQLCLQIYYVGIYFPHHIQTMQFSIKDFFSKYDKISSFQWIWPLATEQIINGNLQFLCNFIRNPNDAHGLLNA